MRTSRDRPWVTPFRRLEAEFAMTITITAWDRSPDGGAGLARDTRVR